MNSPESATSDQPPIGNDLPPVQPPSAGFIIQLFVVPALIVLAVVAVWAMFGRIAAGEQDWKQLVQELNSSNPHVYQRAMFGLAQLLDADRRLGVQGQQLAANPEIAAALSRLLRQQLESRQTDDSTLSSQVYLVRAQGLLDVPAESIPVLITAMKPEFDLEVRKGAVLSVAMIAGRALEAGRPLSGEIVPALIELSRSNDPALKRPATFALGLVPCRESEERLLTILSAPDDWMSNVNAAIALARSKSTAGFPVFTKALTTPAADESVEARQDRLLILKNTLKAIGDLARDFTPEQRNELLPLIGDLADNDSELRVRVDAQSALAALKTAS